MTTFLRIAAWFCVMLSTESLPPIFIHPTTFEWVAELTVRWIIAEIFTRLMEQILNDVFSPDTGSDAAEPED